MSDKKRMSLTRAVHHMSIGETNNTKLSAVDDLCEVYRPLCEQYANHFCLQRQVDSFCEPFYRNDPLGTLAAGRHQPPEPPRRVSVTQELVRRAVRRAAEKTESTGVDRTATADAQKRLHLGQCQCHPTVCPR